MNVKSDSLLRVLLLLSVCLLGSEVVWGLHPGEESVRPLYAQQAVPQYRHISGADPIDDPLPRLYHDGAAVQFQIIATVPASTDAPYSPYGNPRTRLNFLDHAPDGSGRLFVNDLRGQLYTIQPENGTVTLYLDIAPFFAEWKETPGLNTGFSTFAFHPEFAANGRFYTIHTEAPNGTPDYTHRNAEPTAVHGVVVEWMADDPTANTFAGTHRELLRIANPSTIHGIQLAQFNPNATPGNPDYGMLYLSIGDGETPSMTTDAPQDRTTLNGTIIRIDPLGSNSSNGQYGIPTDNPFYDSGGSGRDEIRQEIYAYGFRNPNRFVWDTGGVEIMVTTDIGEDNIEEVNLVQPGANYGWNKREGTFRFDYGADRAVVYPLPTDDNTLGYTYPVAQYDHDDGAAIQGGAIYRGSFMPAMLGMYIFGDIVEGFLGYVDATTFALGTQSPMYRLTLLDEGGEPVEFQALVDPTETRADSRFGVDANGEIYLFSKQDGVIRKLVAARAAPGRALITHITRLSTDSAYQHDIVAATVGAAIYTDHDLQITTLPPSLTEADMLITPNQERTVSTAEHLTFLLAEAADLYVAVDSRATRPDWLNSWEQTALVIAAESQVDNGSTSLTYELYRTHPAAGAVTLGGSAQRDEDQSNGYFVLAAPHSSDGTMTPSPTSTPTSEAKATFTVPSTPVTSTATPTASTTAPTPTTIPTVTPAIHRWYLPFLRSSDS